MKQTKLYIPKKIRVGCQHRLDTYTKKLAYVIYYDEKGKLRKEPSWKNWIHDKPVTLWDSNTQKQIELKDIPPVNDFDNVPTSGFVLNKGVGGQRHSYGWNARNEYIRVYDPRDFEFEISVANLLWILQECSSFKGKGLDGEFVYSWDKKDLVLLPVNSIEYKQCVDFTTLKESKIVKSDLVEGCTYANSNGDELIYLGKHKTIKNSWTSVSSARNHFCFKYIDRDTYEMYSSITPIKKRLTTDIVDGYCDIFDDFQNSDYAIFSTIKDEYVSITSNNVRDIQYVYDSNKTKHTVNRYYGRTGYYIDGKNVDFNKVIRDYTIREITLKNGHKKYS